MSGSDGGGPISLTWLLYVVALTALVKHPEKAEVSSPLSVLILMPHLSVPFGLDSLSLLGLCTNLIPPSSWASGSTDKMLCEAVCSPLSLVFWMSAADTQILLQSLILLYSALSQCGLKQALRSSCACIRLPILSVDAGRGCVHALGKSCIIRCTRIGVVTFPPLLLASAQVPSGGCG